MTANTFFDFMFSCLDSCLSLGFTIFGFHITLWGIFLAGCICKFLFRVLFAYLF